MSEFATYNKDWNHIEVEVPEGPNTVTIKTPTGEQITLAFMPSLNDPQGHRAVEIQHHTGEIKEGHPIQNFIALGIGDTPFVSKQAKTPTTLISLQLE